MKQTATFPLNLNTSCNCFCVCNNSNSFILYVWYYFIFYPTYNWDSPCINDFKIFIYIIKMKEWGFPPWYHDWKTPRSHGIPTTRHSVWETRYLMKVTQVVMDWIYNWFMIPQYYLVKRQIRWLRLIMKIGQYFSKTGLWYYGNFFHSIVVLGCHIIRGTSIHRRPPIQYFIKNKFNAK